MVPVIGSDTLVWRTDFPHLRAPGLDAQEAASKLLLSHPREVREKVAGLNGAKGFKWIEQTQGRS